MKRKRGLRPIPLSTKASPKKKIFLLKGGGGKGKPWGLGEQFRDGVKKGLLLKNGRQGKPNRGEKGRRSREDSEKKSQFFRKKGQSKKKRKKRSFNDPLERESGRLQ